MLPKQLSQVVFAAVTILLGCVLLWMLATQRVHGWVTNPMIIGAVIILVIIAAGTLGGQKVKEASIVTGKTKIAIEYYGQSAALPESIQTRTLDDDTRAEKELLAKEIQKARPLPGDDAPRFSSMLQSNATDLLVRPSAYPMTPMYLLDNAFRILDWNEAFTIAFDRTMEGRKGRGVLEWTYFLDNYEEVLDHGVRVFGRQSSLPRIDVELIKYTSQRYGKLTATKRAYQIPDDSGACLAWLVTLDMRFADSSQEMAYKQDLIRLLGMDLMWSEYAVSYDRLLNSTDVYPALLERLVGSIDGLPAISGDARILDLGAGTGNLTYKLITTGRDRVIFAAENNRIMLEFLRSKCNRFLRNDASAGGVIAFKQDITSLFGLEDNYFDVAVLNNVLYAVQDARVAYKRSVGY